MSPSDANVLLTIDTPAPDHDPTRPNQYPHETREWSTHADMNAALNYLRRDADPLPVVGQRITFEILLSDDPRRFVDWGAQAAASRLTHGY